MTYKYAMTLDGKVAAAVEALRAAGKTYEQDGANPELVIYKKR